MAKLTSLRPTIKPMSSRFSSAPIGINKSRQRDAELPWRKWYGTADWKRLRLSVLERDLFTCQMAECGRFVADTSQLVADHKHPHGGDHALFWDIANLQTLCKHCHDSIKQRLEKRNVGRW